MNPPRDKPQLPAFLSMDEANALRARVTDLTVERDRLREAVENFAVHVANAPERAVSIKHDTEIQDALDAYAVALKNWGTLDHNPSAVLASEDALLRTVVRAALAREK